MKQRREVITAKKAMELLGISRPTLRAYVRQGLLTQINISSRKVRFAQEQVEQLASYGAAETRPFSRRFRLLIMPNPFLNMLIINTPFSLSVNAYRLNKSL